MAVDFDADEVVGAIEKDMARTIREFAEVLTTAAVDLTPVKTGALKRNWQISIGSFSTRPRRGRDRSGTATIVEARAVIASYRRPNRRMYLVNNLPYAGAIDSGTSRKSPMGLSDPAIAAASMSRALANRDI